jgi:hypothetical protein
LEDEVPMSISKYIVRFYAKKMKKAEQETFQPSKSH